MCLNWACTESVRGKVSDGLSYLDVRADGAKRRTHKVREAPIVQQEINLPGNLHQGWYLDLGPKR